MKRAFQWALAIAYVAVIVVACANAAWVPDPDALSGFGYP